MPYDYDAPAHDVEGLDEHAAWSRSEGYLLHIHDLAATRHFPAMSRDEALGVPLIADAERTGDVRRTGVLGRATIVTCLICIVYVLILAYPARTHVVGTFSDFYRWYAPDLTGSPLGSFRATPSIRRDSQYFLYWRHG